MAEKTKKIVGVDLEAKAEKTKSLVKVAETFKILDNTQYEKAGEFLKNLKQILKDFDTERKKATKPMDEAKKKVMDWFKPITEGLKKAIAITENKMTKHYELIQKKKEEEKKTVVEQASTDTDAEKKKIEAEIEKAEADGNIEKVMELLDKKEKVYIPPQEKVAETPKISGLAPKTTWVGICKDFHKMPDEVNGIELKKLSQGGLNELAKSCKGQMDVPGVEFKEETKISGVRS
jgi:chemotaxis protein histidine kinase CheA